MRLLMWWWEKMKLGSLGRGIQSNPVTGCLGLQVVLVP